MIPRLRSAQRASSRYFLRRKKRGDERHADIDRGESNMAREYCLENPAYHLDT
jgi:hypothetical protein